MEKNTLQPENWLETLYASYTEAERKVLHQAWVCLQENALKLEEELREPFIRQRCGTADILHRLLKMDAETLAAVFLKPAAGMPDNKTLEKFAPGIARLAEGVGRMEAIHELNAGQELNEKSRREQTERLRKMLLAMAEDARTVLIKLAERLYDMRMLRNTPDSEQRRAFAHETMQVFAPLANRLGIWKIKWELEDLAFRYGEPETYKRLADLLEAKRTEREAYVQKITAALDDKLQEHKIKAKISGRPKHIYSIWRKMQRKGVDFHQLFDVLAVRALLENEHDCYVALGIVHRMWQPIHGEFDDYIAAPKKNGYKSLHTAVIGPDNRIFEVQIRTAEMHRFAEFGVASHWRYKEGAAQDSGFDQKLAWLRQVLQSSDNTEEDQDSGDFLDEFNSEIVEDRIYVLSPQGKIIELPYKATPLDFAYAIHTGLGHRCRGAKVNNKMVPLTWELKTGDQIEIIAFKEERPSRDWLNLTLNYLKSRRSISKVKQWFKQQDQEQHMAGGRAALERELRRLDIHGVNYDQLAQRFHYPGPNEMFIALGRGDLGPGQIANALKEHVFTADKPDLLIRRPGAASSSKNGAVEIQGVDGLLTHMAGCCKPVPPDPLIGYITRGQGVTVHRQDCPQALHLQETEHERLIEVNWSSPHASTYLVDIQVEAYDRPGLLRDISALLAAEKANITAAHTGNIRDDGDQLMHSKMVLTVEVTGADQLSLILSKIEQIQNVMAAVRKC